jgi:hypothetical protein
MSAAYETEIQQNREELAAFLDLLRGEGIASYLEIGAKFGGTLWRVGQLLPRGGRVVAVDLPHGTGAWSRSSVSLRACIEALRGRGLEAHLILGDSTAVEIVAMVERLAPFDAVLIDANHTLPFVTRDWENYGPMAHIVAFHDIGWSRPPEWTGGVRIDVPELWQRLRGEHRHVELSCEQRNNGIGVLWRQ